MRKNDYQVTEMSTGVKPFTLYQWNGKAFRYFHNDFATRTEEDAFMETNHLELVEEYTVGVWPARIYRQRVR